MTRTIALCAAAVFSFGALGACASSDVTTAQTSEPQAKIAAAEEAGAKEIPEASLHLKLANEQYAKAQKMMEDGDTEEPRLLLARASADAELALAMARLKSTRDRAMTTIEKVNDLRQERVAP